MLSKLFYHTAFISLCSAMAVLPLSAAFAIEPPFSLPQSSDILRFKSAIITTSKGKMTFELYPESAPWHVANFKYLADQGFYRGRAFHILIEDFIIQGGRNNNPDFNYTLPAEFSQHKHEFGTLGMARPADYLNPQRNSSSTQFHVLLREASNMDGSYTIFGKLIEGTDVLESLRRNDRIIDVIVYVEDDTVREEVARPKSSDRASTVQVNELSDVWASNF